MQFYANSNRHPLKTILFFTLVLIVAFLPVSSFLFFLKNDAFNGYFPPKFFMSESIHAGHLPLWNPYINFGIPQYGDMSGGYWSPITWLIASTVGYNAYSLTVELLFYILLGGIGLYKLTGIWQLNKTVRIIAALAFMCCGYNVGHLQHFNWLSGTAFLPWCFWSYLLLLDKFSFKNTVRAALLFYIFISSAHPGIIISAGYFFAGYLLFYFFENKAALSFSTRIKNITASHSVFVFIFLLLSAGMITGYIDLLPQFVRSEKISLADSLLHPTNLQSWISALFPFAIVKNNIFFNNDPSVRNCYFSLTLLLFFILSLLNKKTNLQKFLLVAGLFFALLASGGIFKTLAYKFIPVIGYVRLNGEFRIFTLLCFILVAAFEMDKYIKAKKSFTGRIKWIYYILEIIVIGTIIFGLYKAVSNKDSFIYNIKNITAQQSISLKLKSLIDALSFYDTLWIQGFIQLFLLWGIKWCLKLQDWQLLKKIVVADMVLACLLNIPFTGVGKASVAQVQSVLNQSPKGIPSPKLIPLINNDKVSANEEALVGNWSLYNKQIGTAKFVPYPIMLKNMMAYFDKDSIINQENHLDKPYIFADDTTVTSITVQSFAPQKIDVTVVSNAASQLVLQQNFYPHWYYFNGVEKKAVNQYGINFMSVPVAKGENHISFLFEPAKLKIAMLLSAVVFIICCVLLFLFSIRSPSPSSLQQ